MMVEAFVGVGEGALDNDIEGVASPATDGATDGSSIERSEGRVPVIEAETPEGDGTAPLAGVVGAFLRGPGFFRGGFGTSC